MTRRSLGSFNLLRFALSTMASIPTQRRDHFDTGLLESQTTEAAAGGGCDPAGAALDPPTVFKEEFASSLP